MKRVRAGIQKRKKKKNLDSSVPLLPITCVPLGNYFHYNALVDKNVAATFQWVQCFTILALWNKKMQFKCKAISEGISFSLS